MATKLGKLAAANKAPPPTKASPFSVPTSATNKATSRATVAKHGVTTVPKTAGAVSTVKDKAKQNLVNAARDGSLGNAVQGKMRASSKVTEFDLQDVPPSVCNACREAFGGESRKLKAGDVSKVLARMDDSIDWSEFVATCGLTGPDGMVEFDTFLEFVYSSKAPPNAAKVIFKAEFDAWWKQAGPKLFTTITKTKEIFADGERWASAFVGFVTHGLSVVRWEPVDGERIKDTTTKESYVSEYYPRLRGRSDVAADNLWQLKGRIDDLLLRVVKSAPAQDLSLKSLLQTLAIHKDTLTWSQGGFGPKAYSGSFLRSYANATITEVFWRQPKHRYGMTCDGKKCFLDCGILYADAGVELPLHHASGLEAFYVLAGETRFVWLLDGKLVHEDKKPGEWHFNPPHIPHAITTPHGKPHLSLWFREGGPGQAHSVKFGPKWVGAVDGLDWVQDNLDDDIPDEAGDEDDSAVVGRLGFARGTIVRLDCRKFAKLLTPEQWDSVGSDRSAVMTASHRLAPGRQEELQQQVESLRLQSQRNTRKT